jgi:hypothetical protein
MKYRVTMDTYMGKVKMKLTLPIEAIDYEQAKVIGLQEAKRKGYVGSLVVNVEPSKGHVPRIVTPNLPEVYIPDRLYLIIAGVPHIIDEKYVAKNQLEPGMIPPNCIDSIVVSGNNLNYASVYSQHLGEGKCDRCKKHRQLFLALVLVEGKWLPTRACRECSDEFIRLFASNPPVCKLIK